MENSDLRVMYQESHVTANVHSRESIRPLCVCSKGRFGSVVARRAPGGQKRYFVT